MRSQINLVSDGSVQVEMLVLRDAWDKFGEEDLEPYFNTSYEKFTEALNRFRTLARTLTPLEEKNLRFMLDSLIHTKNTIYLQEDN